MEPVSDTEHAIAIIGFSLRFPQDANTQEGFWKMLIEGRSASTEVPPDRFNVDGYYSPDEARLDAIPCRGGHFLRENIALFDAPFFSMSAAEAECMDPEIRGLLETTYRAFENAGISTTEARGSNTSVYMGHISGEYEKLFGMDEEIQTKYRAIGNSTAMMSNRLSWFYDLKGPCMTIETACSSSLVALHLACNSLRSGESSMSIVGGSGLYLDPMASVVPLSNFNFLSPDSRCHSFDARANGYAKGEGFGVLVLKRVSDALRDGDTIRAVIRGTATNHDGQTASITKPSADAQVQLITNAYKASSLDFASTRYFEAHGTGTYVGDAIEADAILRVFGSARSIADPLYVGSTKANIGHLEAAAGMAGVIKAILVLEEGVIPPIASLEDVSPEISNGNGVLAFPRKAVLWPQSGLRRASVGGYGYGGTNAHVILDDALHYLQDRGLVGRHCTKGIVSQPTEFAVPAEAPSSGQPVPPYLLVWSASDEKGIQRLADSYVQHISKLIPGEAPTYLRDLAYTLGAKRNRLPWKSFALIASLDEIRDGLTRHLSKPVRSSFVAPSPHFVFTGQGAQWPNMGLALLVFPVFKASVMDANRHFQSLGASWSIIEEIKKDKHTSNIDDPSLAQPICTALQVALVDLLASWKVVPESVVGHSSGEIAAAYCAGYMARESAWSVAYFRGLVTSNLISSQGDDLGAMMAVSLPSQDLEPYFDVIRKMPNASEISVGCENSPKSSTVTGSASAIEALQVALEAKGVFTRKLRIPVAYHSQYMLRVAMEYKECLVGIVSPRKTTGSRTIKMFSSVTGDQVDSELLASPDYWVQNLVSKVAFSDAVQSLYNSTSEGHGPSNTSRVNYFIEIGPHITMERNIKESLPANTVFQYGTSMRRHVDSILTMKSLAGELIARGYPVDIDVVNRSLVDEEEPKMLTSLPEYPFNHSKSYWMESRLSKSRRFRSHARHNLLGNPCPDWNPSEAKWRYTIRQSEHSWIKHHIVNGSILYPAAGMLVMVIEAARFLSADDANITGYQLRDVVIHSAITVPGDDRGVETEITLRSLSQSRPASHFQNSREFCIYAIIHGDFRTICSGTVITTSSTTDADVFCNSAHGNDRSQVTHDFDHFSQSCTEAATEEQVYKMFEGMGIEFGPAFQTLHDIYLQRSTKRAIATVVPDGWKTKVESGIETSSHVVHPTALDSLFQLPIVSLTEGGLKNLPTMVPTEIADLWISHDLFTMRENLTMQLHGRTLSQKKREINVAVTAYDSTTLRPLIALRNARMTAVNGAGKLDHDTKSYRKLCYQLDWKPDLDFLEKDQVAMLCSKGTDHLPAPTDQIVEIVCMHFMAQTLDVLALEEQISLPDHLRKYVAWAKDVLTVIDANSILQESKWVEIFTDQIRRANFLESVSAMSPAHRAWVEFGHHLVSILRGETDPLHLMFNHKLASDIYRGAVFTYSLERLAAYVDMVAHKNSGINILEVGAGTGSGTEPVLRMLEQQGNYSGATPRYSQYDYTDISPSFFEGAKRRFATHANRLNFKILDIERDPTEQGGGHLLLMEPTNLRSVIIPFFAGVLPGWWRGTEPERSLTALFTKEQWDNTLRRAGFTGVDVVLEDDTNTSSHVCSFLASRVEVPREDTVSPPTIHILAGDTPSQTKAAANIQARLASTKFSNTSVISPSSVSKVGNGAILVSLLELEHTSLVDMSEQEFLNLHNYMDIFPRQIWVTHGGGPSARRPETALISGFGQSIVLEKPGFTFIHLDIEDLSALADVTTRILDKFWNTAQRDVETDLAEFQGMIHVPRVIEAKGINDAYNAQFGQRAPKDMAVEAQPAMAMELQFAPGRLENFHFAQIDHRDDDLSAGEVEIQVLATGITPRDVMITLNQASDDYLGQDFAGVITKVAPGVKLMVGDRVCGICQEGSFKTFVRASEHALMRIPDHISFPDAASLPSASVTAHYGLTRIARIEAGERVLIHAAADYLGQIAIQVAQHMGADVFATVRTATEKDQVLEQFNIPADQIFSCQSLEFASQILQKANGVGLDVIFNSLPGDILTESWRCMAPLGRFVETGMHDKANAALPTAPFMKGATFATVDIGAVSLNRSLIGRVVKEIEAMLFTTPQILVPPPSVEVFKRSEFEDAFKYMQKGTRRAVVDWSVADVIQVIPSQDRFSFPKNASYVIAGGLGGIGRSIATWMAERGAAHLILLSRSGTQTEAAKSFVSKLQSQGVQVFAPHCDITDEKVVAAVIHQAQLHLPPIRGCVHSGMVVETDMFDRMSLDKFQASLKPKVHGTWNLHNNLPANLDFFILLSSLAGVHGAPVQSNYAAGCAFQDAFARFRHAQGQRGVAFDMGVVTTVGYIAERSSLAKSLALSYTSHDVIDEQDILFMMERACSAPSSSSSSSSAWESQWLSALTTPAQVAKSGLVKEHAWMQKPMFRHLFQMDRTAASVASDPDVPGFEALIKATQTLDEAREVIASALVSRLSRSLMVPLEDIDVHMPMYKYGVDSLVAIEIQFWFSREIKTKVSVLQMLSGSTIAELSLIAAEGCEYLAH
ncbi:hypothetical protein GQ44DRAFT_831130 [Phaeosphaeriaceae sp. PMI808]|nr:hypothetical protein GQ44DRAFT_831130 [Phaeosphaeriaceae sp. PMI808]